MNNDINTSNPPTRFSPKVKALTCPSCGAGIDLKVPDSITVVCGSCGSIIDLKANGFNIALAGKINLSIKPIIPLGSRGKLKGILWEVIGFMKRRDPQYSVYWDEYLLFNPRYGYKWLTEYKGHWNFISTIKLKPKASNIVLSQHRISVDLLNHKYFLYGRGLAEVTHVLGEFYWRVKVGDEVQTEDYIDPPYMLSRETDQSENIWSLGEYIESEKIGERFQVSELLPAELGVSPNQPSPHNDGFTSLLAVWAIFVGILIFFQFMHLSSAQSKEVYSNSFSLLPQEKYNVKASDWSATLFNRKTFPSIAIPSKTSDKTNNEFSTNSFELKGGKSTVEIHLSAPVDNNGLYISGELINEEKGLAYPIDQTIEYYHGVSGGESWSEGSNQSSLLLSSIPDGKYRLDFETSTYPEGSVISPINASIKRATPLWSNFLWSLILISLPFLWRYSLRYSFEVQRWEESDFSPYASSEE
jgi:uncharacterized protein YbaR (Trm112 family)